MTDTIQVTEGTYRGKWGYHVAGCAHLHKADDTDNMTMTVAHIAATQRDAKKYGTENPIAPCLRKAVTR